MDQWKDMNIHNLPYSHQGAQSSTVSFIVCARLWWERGQNFEGQWWGEEEVLGGVRSKAKLKQKQMYAAGS